jgi:hypothetical protein
MTTPPDDHAIDALLRAADPWPDERPVDPMLATRALAHVEKEIQMTESEAPKPIRGRRTRMLALAATALVAIAAVAAVTQLGGEDTAAPGGSGRTLGSPLASCIRFSLEELARAPIAFDGTVTDIADDGTITFDVETWFRGGEGETMTAKASDLIQGEPSLEGGVGFVEGQRYLVSGDDTTGTFVPAICGFSMEYTSEMAADWARAFGS